MSRPNVLLIDDDPRLGELLTSYLGQSGFDVTVARDGVQGLDRIRRARPDVVLLDVMMPGIDGLEVCRRIRADAALRALPVLMLTARGDETDRVVGLELGADDYLSKPFGPRELLARVRALLRRAQPEAPSERLECGDLIADLGARTVTRAGRLIDLTGLEFDLLVAFLRRPGRVIARETLLRDAGRGDVIVSERTVDVHISHLRQKLGDTDSTVLRTVRGVGYVLAQDAGAGARE